MYWQIYWVQHNGTLFLHEAIWNLFIHRGNESFPVVFEPAVMRKQKNKTKKKKKKKSESTKRQKTVLKKVTRSQHRAVKYIRQANNKHQNQYQPSEGGQAVPPHAAVSSVSEWVSVAWPDLSCSRVLSCLRCSCLPIRHSLPPVSKPPPPWCPNLTHSLSCTHTHTHTHMLRGSEGEKRGQK